ncbi:hypothetical protein V1264_020717 [Littorina saxatilis]
MNRRSSTGSGHYHHDHHHHLQQLDLKAPTSPGATSVWVGSHPSPDHAHPISHAHLGNGDDSAAPRRANSLGTHCSNSRDNNEEGRYVVVAVRDSTSDSEPNSRRSSTVNSPQSNNGGGFRSGPSTSFDSPFSYSYSSSSPTSPWRSGRVSTSSVDSGGPFSPATSPRVNNESPQFQANDYLQSAATLPRNLGSRSSSSSTSHPDNNRYQSATLARTGNLRKTNSSDNNNYRSAPPARTGSFQNPSFTGNFQNTSLFGNTNRNSGRQRNDDYQSTASPRNSSSSNMMGDNNPQGSEVVGNSSVFLGTGNFPGTALAGNTSNILGGPSSVLGSTSTLYNGGNFLPAAASSMATLPQPGYDPNTYLLQQQLSPELLAASMNQTLNLCPSLTLSPTQTGNFSQQQLMALSQAQPMQSMNFSQTQPMQSLYLQQTQPMQSYGYSQAQPMQSLNLQQTQPMQSLNYSQAQPMQSMNYSQAQPMQSLNYSQAQQMQSLNYSQAQPMNSLSLSQAGSLLSPSLSQAQAPQYLDGSQGAGGQQETSMPYLGHSFDMLSAAVAANQAVMSPTPDTPPPFSPQLLPMGATSGLPPTLTGIPPAGQTSFSPPPPPHHPPPPPHHPPHHPPPPPYHPPPPPHHPPPHGPPSLFNDYGSKSPVSRTSSHELGVQKRGVHATSSLDHTDDQGTSGVGSSIPSSPSDSSPTSPHSDLHLATSGDEGQGHVLVAEPCYLRPKDKQTCLRCRKKVYAMEKLGPVKDVLYHKTCFTCAACHTTLNLKNFHHNEADMGDLNVYCISHKPVSKANPLDSHSVGIQRALTVPKRERVNDQIRGGPESHTNLHMDTNSISIQTAMHVPAANLESSIKPREGTWFREDRKAEATPPRDVVRHDWSQSEYEGSRSLYINPS